MEQSVIDKLMELKTLYEAGILTKEELEAEKQKVLGNEIAEETPQKQHEAVVQKTASASANPEEKRRNKGLWSGIGMSVLVLIIIIYVVVSNKKETYQNALYGYNVDSIAEDDAIVYDIIEYTSTESETTNYNQESSSNIHYRVNREVSVYHGPGANYEVALFEAQGGAEYPASYSTGSIVESTGWIESGYIYVSDCGCQGGHGSNQDGWIPVNAVSQMSICNHCGGAGYFNFVCPECDGGAYYSCSCHGRGRKVCEICGGVGAI